MEVLVYAHPESATGERLATALTPALDGRSVATCRNMGGLMRRLCQPRADLRLAILVAESADELSRFVLMKDLLSDVPLILVLPDSLPETVRAGHSLYPRLVVSATSDFAELAAVVARKCAP